MATKKEYQEVIEDLCYQFCGWDDRIGGLTTDGLGPLEQAFFVLGWDDPHPVQELCCDEPGCKKRITCGTPTATGYRSTCGQHRPKAGE